MKNTIIRLVMNAEPALLKCDPHQVYNATVLYLFRGINYRTYGAKLSKMIGTKANVRAVTEALSSGDAGGYLLKNWKVWAFYVVKNKLSQQDALVFSRRWKIHRSDAMAFLSLGRTVLAYMRKLAREYVAYTLEEFDRLVNNMVTSREFTNWLGKFTSKKHKFIADSQSYTLQDVRKELLCNGIEGLYTMYPCMKTELHALNIVKRTIHNTGINLIYHFTSQKAGRLIKTADGRFEARMVSMESVRETLEMQQIEFDNDLKIDFAKILNQYHGKKRKFIELLAGNYCAKFTQWLQERGHKIETNESLQERMKLKVYAVKCLEFLEVKLEVGLKFVERLKAYFMPYKGVAA